MHTAPTVKLRLKAYLNLLLLPLFPPVDCLSYITYIEMEADGVLHFIDQRVIRPFRVSEVATGQLLLIFITANSLPSTGPEVDLIFGLLWRGFEAVIKLAPQTFLEFEGALSV